MRARTKGKAGRLMDTDDFMSYVGLGKNSALKFGNQIGAKIRIGRRTLWDKNVIDAAIDEMVEAEK
ncbi:MAG: hypothetical protein LUG62_08850 [Clostridiales bacterium]|nr:hypothetical protein [Clostridiales bacterium]